MTDAKILAFIPARGGSKRVLNKNIRCCAGRPLLYWTISAAQMSKFDLFLHVSTDSQEIADCAGEFGVTVPFLRSSFLSSDTVDLFGAYEETILAYKRRDIVFDYIIVLQPTSPLRSYHDIDNALDLLTLERKRNCSSVISISELEHPGQWSMDMDEDGTINKFARQFDALSKVRSQDFKKSFRLNGAIYASGVDDLLKYKTFFLSKGDVHPLIMPKERSIDIDDENDFELAQFLLNRKFGEKF